MTLVTGHHSIQSFAAALALAVVVMAAAAAQEPEGKTERGQGGSGAAAAPSSDPPAPPPVDEAARPGINRGSLLRLIFQANPMLWPLAACSIFTLGIALERIVALRRKRIVPAEFVERFLERLSAGKLDRERALELCKANESPVARLFAMVVKSSGQPGAMIRQSVSFDAAGELIDLKRNLRVLNGMATLGPLLGLLGTVVGIIQSFDALGGRLGPARGEALAQGISLALVATAFGLVVAIFAVASYYFLLNRVDLLVRDLDGATRQVIDLVSAEAIGPGRIERRTGGGGPSPTEPLRQETRVFG